MVQKKLFVVVKAFLSPRRRSSSLFSRSFLHLSFQLFQLVFDLLRQTRRVGDAIHRFRGDSLQDGFGERFAEEERIQLLVVGGFCVRARFCFSRR